MPLSSVDFLLTRKMNCFPILNCFIYGATEAVVRRCFMKKGACNFIKNKTLAQVFSCEFFDISKNTFFYRTPLVAAFRANLSKVMLVESFLIITIPRLFLINTLLIKKCVLLGKTIFFLPEN